MSAPSMISYTVRSADATQNEERIAAVFAELRRQRVPGLAYTVYRLEDEEQGTTFVHVVDGDDARLRELDAFADFQSELSQLLLGPPTRRAARLLGTYDPETSPEAAQPEDGGSAPSGHTRRA